MKKNVEKKLEEVNIDYTRNSLWAKIPLYLMATVMASSLVPMNAFAFERDLTIAEMKQVQMENQKSVKKDKEEAKELLFQAPEATPLTVEGEEVLKEHYVEKYMPVEGCSLTEELPVTSDINYVPPKPKVRVVEKEAVVQKAEVKVAVQEKAPVKAKAKVKVAKKVAVAKSAPVNGSAISMTADERYWLEKLVEAESAGESFEGKLAVATVIANRVELKEFPNTVMGVIRAPKQFSPFMDGSINRRIPSADTLKAVAMVFDQGHRNVSKDTAFFCTTEIAPYSWISKNKAFDKTIGNHNFYMK